MISVVVPTLNEAAVIGQTLTGLQSWRAMGHEIILADGGSVDATVNVARPWVDTLLDAPPGRSAQMNAGASVARGDWLFFLHADTRLPPDALPQLLMAIRSGADWGRFDVCLSGRHPMLAVIAGFINLRSRLTGIATGDQGIFVRKSRFDALGGYAAIPLMEDIELSRRLRVHSRPACIDSPVATDSRRWERNGLWRTIVLMWRLRWRYWRGEDPATLARLYYRPAGESAGK